MPSNIQITDNSATFLAEKDAAVLRVLETIGFHLEGEAKDELENDPKRVDTGTLKNSITHRTMESERAVYIGTNVEYAPYVHEGTRRMAPNRFLRNAVEVNENQIREMIKRELKG